MPRFLSILLFTGFICATTGLQALVEQPDPVAVKGVIDLTDHDFNKGPVELKGEFSFIHSRFISTVAEFEKTDSVFYTRVPGSWNAVLKKAGYSSGTGYGTFILRLQLPDSDKIRGKLAIRHGAIGTAQRMFIDGRMISSAGSVSKAKEKAEGDLKAAVSEPFSSDFKYLFVQVSNYHDRSGGIWYPLYLGYERQLISDREKLLSFDTFLFGAILIMAVYHFVLFYLRRKDLSTLMFGLVCLFVALRLSVSGERFLQNLFEEIPHRLVVSIDYFSFYVATPAFYHYFRLIFPFEFSKLLMKAAWAVGTVLALTVLVLPTEIFTRFLIFQNIWVLLLVLYSVFKTVLASAKGRQGSTIFIIGTLIFSLSVINDVLYNFEIIETLYMLPFGLLVFIFFQSVLLSTRFAKAFTRVEELSETLQHRNEQLQRALKSETELAAINRELDLARALQMQLLPAETPSIRGLSIEARYMPMHSVGGDFFDFDVNDHYLRAIIADVSGHGVPAALIVSMLKIAFSAETAIQQSTAGVLEKMNSILTPHTGGNFITACMVQIDLDEKKLKVSMAGHPPLLLYRARTEQIEIIKTKGTLMGAFNEREFDMSEITLEENDRIIMYTDGIIEARPDRPHDETSELLKEFSESAFHEFIIENNRLETAAFADKLSEAVISHSNGVQNLSDDFACIIIDVRSSESADA